MQVKGSLQSGALRPQAQLAFLQLDKLSFVSLQLNSKAGCELFAAQMSSSGLVAGSQGWRSTHILRYQALIRRIVDLR